MASRAKAKTGKAKAVEETPLLVLIYRSRRVLVDKSERYEYLHYSIRNVFPDIPPHTRISFHTKSLPVCEGVLTEVTPEVWATAMPLLNSLTVVVDDATESPLSPALKRYFADIEAAETSCDENDDPKRPAKKPRTRSQAPIPQSQRNMTLSIDLRGTPLNVKCHPSMSIVNVLSEMLLTSPNNHSGFNFLDYRITLNGGLLDREECEEHSIGDLGIEYGDRIEVMKEQRGGKPVIYLFPPAGKEIDASVKLSLVPEWQLSAIYPVVDIHGAESGGQTCQWDVKASSDGTLLEKNTGLDVAYLFWEAEAHALEGQPHLGAGPIETFIPNRAYLRPADSAVLQVANITPYLNSALGALGLHTEARTSFITYWLPSLLKHKYVALQFLPQSAYEKSAPLAVSPAPDVTVRVFMLFKGLREEEIASGSKWHDVIVLDHMDVARWKNVVGVDESKSLADSNLFRVIEWGGMEVVS